MVEIWLPHLPRNNSIFDDLYVELVATFDLKRHTCNNLAVEEVISAARIYKNGDGLLFKESSNFHRLQVGVTGQHVHCIIGRLGLFLCGFIFEFEVFFRWYEGAKGFDMAGRGATLVLRLCGSIVLLEFLRRKSPP
ncbi:hypothetical protein GW17_00028447 [Ensete ventricosum]|nr:hypothetical protein GW17_00028447 [Ensete ventricosum]